MQSSYMYGIVLVTEKMMVRHSFILLSHTVYHAIICYFF